MNITFLPYSDVKDFSKAIKEYQDIWAADGKRIIDAWEAAAGISFVEKNMNAFVWDGISHAPPLCLRDTIATRRKKSVLVHELGHCLINSQLKGSTSLERHKIHYLVLYDILTDLYDEEYAKETVADDTKLNPMYGEAWNFALLFPTREMRKNKFNEMMKSYEKSV